MKQVLMIVFLSVRILSFSQMAMEDSLLFQQYSKSVTPMEKHILDTSYYDIIKLMPDVDERFLEHSGISVLRRLSLSCYIVSNTASILDRTTNKISLIMQANHLWKLAPALSYQAAHYRKGKAFFNIEVSSSKALFDFVRNNSNDVDILCSYPPSGLWSIKTTDSFFFQHILPLYFLKFADRGDKRAETEAPISSFNQIFNSINVAHSRYPELRAEGLNVSVKEDRFDTTDIDIIKRTIIHEGSSKVVSSHATSMATIIGGAGNSYYTGRGVVDAALLHSSNFDRLTPDPEDYYRKHNIMVQNHSYGVGIENYYGSEAAAYDASMYKDSSLLHVFSSGNAGDKADTLGRYKDLTGFANLTGNFKTAKNVITVGAIDSRYVIPLQSSRGPAHDGRIKPDLVAYGQGGSSEAAAIVSGTVLLLQDAYRKRHNGNRAASALLKAVLINSADDILPKGPDFNSGYGSINVLRATETIINRNFINGKVGNNEYSIFTIAAPSNAKNLKITLVWNDLPASPNVFTALINDLDMTVSDDVSGKTWHPFILNSYPALDSLQQYAREGRDSLNTIEQIIIADPAAKIYTIKVKGSRVTGTPQAFYVAYQWDTVNTFQWTSPVTGDNFLAGSNNIFKWESRFATRTAKLEISYDSGGHWNTITENVLLDQPYYNWAAPDTSVNTAVARMTVGNDIFETSTFTISKQDVPLVGLNCDDSLMLYWSPVPGANGYRLFHLKDKYMEPVMDTHNSYLVIRTPDPKYPYYALSTLDSSNSQRIKSYAISYLSQGVSCYFKSFLASLGSVERSAALDITLGSYYNLESAGFEKQTKNGWQLLGSFKIDSSLAFKAFDSLMSNGLNKYRAVLTTNMGQKIYSTVSTVYYWNNKDFLFFPNPVAVGSFIQVLAKNPTAKTICIYDMLGRQILRQSLSSMLEQISLAGISRGGYILIVMDQFNKQLASQKLVVF